ncbi:MAG TPA: hypothetical protein VK112_03315 [Fodinibius sp.]|nr:hypothetical protein [Fodinibius sp.]
MTNTKQFPLYLRTLLQPGEWQQQKADHERAIDEQIAPYLEARSRQQKDPVMDFLFEYYAFRPSHLKSWTPGLGTRLINGAKYDWRFGEMESLHQDAYLAIRHFDQDRISAVRWILDMLKQSAQRKPSFGCFGMHEWAMVYKAKHIRHGYLELRMEMDELAAFVESRPLVCTHFDAFRFFTGPAKPRNKYELSRQKFSQMEQPGCLHTNMDLYKWTFKMYPWISSETIRKAFELAVETRMMDMKASPYDLRERGLEPIKIETKEGRLEYVETQQAIFEKSQPIRRQLIREYQQMLSLLEEASKD